MGGRHREDTRSHNTAGYGTADNSSRAPLTWGPSDHPVTDQDNSVGTAYKCLIMSGPNQGTTQSLSQTSQHPYYLKKVAADPSRTINNSSLF